MSIKLLKICGCWLCKTVQRLSKYLCERMVAYKIKQHNIYNDNGCSYALQSNSRSLAPADMTLTDKHDLMYMRIPPPCHVMCSLFIIHCVMVLLLFVCIHMLCFVLIWLCEPVCISK